jgi:hypothetical protein
MYGLKHTLKRFPTDIGPQDLNVWAIRFGPLLFGSGFNISLEVKVMLSLGFFFLTEHHALKVY